MGPPWAPLGPLGAHMGQKSSPETRLGTLGEFLVQILDFSGPVGGTDKGVAHRGVRQNRGNRGGPLGAPLGPQGTNKWNI